MKTIIALLVLVSFSAQAERVCYGKIGNCEAMPNLICGDVEKLNDTTYRISSIQHHIGCMDWGVSKYKSKNVLCKKLLKKFGEKKKVRFLRGTDIKGEWETAYGFESTGQIDCEIKE